MWEARREERRCDRGIGVGVALYSGREMDWMGGFDRGDERFGEAAISTRGLRLAGGTHKNVWR